MAGETGETRNDELDEQAEARRRTALAQIRQWGDPALRMPAREVEAFDEDLGRLVERMQRLMRDANGVGLAANQVGIVRRVLVFLPELEAEPVALVNPSLVERSDEVAEGDEGCLSLQGVTVPVERSVAVTVEGQGADGAGVRLELEGLAARVVQHELDHLDGVLILDRTTPEARREALGALRPQPILALQQ
ncbi:MAG: peptide deformylase [Actinobacteria bacterium]|nr:peptide deformylase [Actinomycetota bacterium]